MSKQQRYLNFTRGNKLYILREVAPLLPYPRMMRVLRSIDECHWRFARDEATVTLSYKQIAKYDGMSVPTARRGIQNLIDYNLLIKRETVTQLGQQANSYQIVWPNLDGLVNDGEPLSDPAPVPEDSTSDNSETPAPDLEYESSQVLKVGGDHHDHPPDHGDYPPDHHDHPPPDHHDQATIYPININPPPPVINKPTWEEVEDLLISEFGLGRPSPAVKAAEKNGCAPADILQLVAYARSKPGAYGPGALFIKIKEARPGRDPSQGWPAEEKTFLQGKALESAEARRAREASERQAKREAAEHAQQLLERDYGNQLDAMGRADLRAFAAAHCPAVVAKAVAKDPDDAIRPGGFYRVTVLEALKARKTECLDYLDSADVDGTAFVDQR